MVFAVAVTTLLPAEPVATDAANAVLPNAQEARRTWDVMAVLASVGWLPE